jgi:hypothetical protein
MQVFVLLAHMDWVFVMMRSMQVSSLHLQHMDLELSTTRSMPGYVHPLHMD